MIKSLFDSFCNYLNNLQKSQEQKYLEDSVDAVDLEHRQRRIMNGTAPYQRNYDHTRNYLVERY
jgi:hypothetical protein